MAKFNSPSLDVFSGENSAYPVAHYGHGSSVSSQGQLDFNLQAYNISPVPQYAHSVQQNYQSNMPDRQMTNSFISQNQPQQSDQYYPYHTQSSSYYPQNHQAVANQLQPSPASPCHNQTPPGSLLQSQNPAFSPLPGNQQISQVSSRHFNHYQTTQNPLISTQNSQQFQTSQNQQHQPGVLLNGSGQQQRLNQSPKTAATKLQSSQKDRSNDSQFYPPQYLQRNDTSGSSMQKIQACVNNFGHMGQPTSPSHVPHIFQNGRASGQVNVDSQTRSLHCNQPVGNKKGKGINQSKTATYVSPSPFEQQYRFGKNDAILNSSQRLQKAPQVSPNMYYRAPLANSPNSCVDSSMFSDYCNVTSGYPQCSVSSVGPLAKPPPEYPGGAFTSVQNASRNMKGISAYGKEGADLLLAGNMNSRPERPVAVNKPNTRVGGQALAAQKNTSAYSNASHWYTCPDTSLASSFQSDIEAMQADVASYATANKISGTPSRASAVSQTTPAHNFMESHVTGPSQKSQVLENGKNSNVTNVKPSDGTPSVKEGYISTKNARAEALAAIQIKQEMVDNLNKFKIVNSKNAVNTVSVNSPTVATTSQINTAGTNLATPVKAPQTVDNRRNTHPQPQLEKSAKRQLSTEVDSRISESDMFMQCLETPPYISSHLEANNKTPKATDHGSEYQKVAGKNIKSGQQALVQLNEARVPDVLDRVPGNRYEMQRPSDLRQNVSGQKPLTPRHSENSQDVSKQSIMTNFSEQVHSMDTSYSSGNKTSKDTVEKLLQTDFLNTVNQNERGLSRIHEKRVPSHCEGMADTLSAQMVVKNTPTRVPDQDIAVGTANYVSAVKESTVQPAPNTFCQETNSDKQILIKMEKSYDSVKLNTTLCYVILHGHRLLCLRSHIESVILLCQFLFDCFPDKSIESVNICVDPTLKINKKVLNHRERDKIVLFLNKKGYPVGSVVHTVSLNEARQIYHHLYGITHCVDSACVMEMFDNKVDLDRLLALPSNKQVLKKEKKAVDDNSYGILVSSSKPISSYNCPPEREHHQTLSADTSHHVGGKLENSLNSLLNSQQAASLPSLLNSCLDSLSSDHTGDTGNDSDHDDPDDLILVEASENPHVIRWSHNSPKVGGLCNTIVGQLRSYVHENENFLVVDDLCRVFGSSDFYDGVEKENIILYSCCQEIANFLNTVSTNFSPIQSLHHSLVKGKDIGIHITDSNYTSFETGLDKDILVNQVLKRPLCKQEITDDDCSSPKQPRLESSIQSMHRQQSLLNRRKHTKEDSVNTYRIGSVMKSVNIEQTDVVCSVQPLKPVGDETLKSRASSVSLTERADTQSQIIQNNDAANLAQGNLPRVNSSCGQSYENNDHSRSANIGNTSLSSTEVVCDLEPVGQHSELSTTAETGKEISVSGMPDKNIKEAGVSTNVNTNHLSSFKSPRSAASMRDKSPVFSPPLFSAVILDDIDQSQSKNPQLVSHEKHCKDLSTETVPLDNSYIPYQTISIHESPDSEANKFVGLETTDNFNHLESIAAKQAQPVNNLNPLSQEIVEDSAKQETVMEKSSDTSSDILKSRLEKIKLILESKKSKDMSLSADGVNLNLLTDNILFAQDKAKSSDDSSTALGIGSSSHLNHNTEHSDSNSGRLDSDSGSTVIKSESHEQVSDDPDVILLDDCSLNEAAQNNRTIDSNTAALSKRLLLSKDKTLPQETSTDFLSILGSKEFEAPLSFLVSPEYFSGNRRSMDDTDVLLSSGIDILDSRTSSCRNAYAKLWQEHKALLATVETLKKCLAKAKEEREKSEKISKVYEGVVREIKSTLTTGTEDTPVIIDDD